MKKWLFNPFVYLAGSRALFLGLIAMLATSFIGYYSHIHFDGVIDIHLGSITSMNYFLEQVIDLGTIVVLFFIGGLIFSRSSIRLIDVAGTLALARWVMIFPAIIGFFISAPTAPPHTIEGILKTLTPGMVVFGLFGVVFGIWMIALMYYAFTVSCNMKGGKATAIFIAVLVIAEIMSSFIIHLFLEPLF